MKKIALIISALLIVTSSLCANNTVTRNYNFGKITSIEAGSIFSIEITQGNEKGVRVECDEVFAEHLDIKYSDGELKLALKPNSSIDAKRDNQGIKVFLQMPAIEDIDLSGAATLKANGEFTTIDADIETSGASSIKGLILRGKEISLDCSGASTLELSGEFSQKLDAEISGASKVKLDADGNNLIAEVSGAATLKVNGAHNNTEISCSGASNVKMEGNTRYLKSTTAGASKFDGEKYVASNGYAEVSGASNAKVKCIEELKVNVSKSSKLTYYMNPTIINLNPDKTNILQADKHGNEVPISEIEPELFQGQPSKAFRIWLLNQLENKWKHEKSFNGKALIQFVVGADGMVRDFKLIKSTGNVKFDQLLAETVYSSPQWKPLVVSGTAVDKLFTLPITFKGTPQNKNNNSPQWRTIYPYQRNVWGW